jgi:hypothetical protein
MVVLMRSGTRTVLSMQNDYQGPPESFAMVVPVPAVLSAATCTPCHASLRPGRRAERAAPRGVLGGGSLCVPRATAFAKQRRRGVGAEAWTRLLARARARRLELRVRVEAEFAVGEYDIAILSATTRATSRPGSIKSTTTSPSARARCCAPTWRAGTKFFVARVDASRVTFRDGRAVLSPLRVAVRQPRTSPCRCGSVS